ncbi:putative methyltransferase (TIGR04325 family) [Bradyrhizobium sp. F1.4.3]|uniref:methyltransferase, TIGR04325 family n=1 Tax=Bradyrhizobium sp. F1.4.3 TaxID=3156356 RepID=UPI00339487B6
MAQSDSTEGHWLSKSGMRKGLRDTVFAVPLVSDVVRKHWNFLSRVGACRGVFSTYQETEDAAATVGPLGYNDHLVFGPEIRGDPADMRKRDYPVLFWLSRALAESSKILNLGGSAGMEYFTYRQFLGLPRHVIWMVCELPHAVEFGSNLARSVNAPELAFTTRIEDGAGADIFLCCGALQYLEQDLAACLARLQPLPTRVLINRVPVYEGETFFTLQSSFGSVVPYRIQNRQELVDSMIDLGYQLVDCWYEKREIVIPFHPARSIHEFYGFYFASNELAAKDWDDEAVATAHEVRARITHPWMARTSAPGTA